LKVCNVSITYKTKSLMMFPDRCYQILTRIKAKGHAVSSLVMAPCGGVSNPYIGYGLGTVSQLIRAMRNDVDVFLADKVETGLFSLICKKLRGRPFVFDFIDYYVEIARDGEERLRPYYTSYLEKTVPKFADHVIVVIEPFKNRLNALGVPEDKITVIPNGADTLRFNPNVNGREIREKYNLQSDLLIVYVGKIEPCYHLDVIVKAASLVHKNEPSSKFLFVGTGRALNDLKALAKKLGNSDWIIFTGFQPYERIPNFVGAADVTVFPHPSGIAVHEYMACGKPIVKVRAEMGDVLEHLKSGFLVERRTPENFAKGILTLLSDRGLSNKLGVNARKLAVEKYDWETLTERYLEVLKSVC